MTVERGKITDSRIALASVAPKTIRLEEVEKFLNGNEPGEELFKEAAQLCAKLCSPITDARATEGYRRKMAAVWAEKALLSAYDKIGG